MNTRSSLWAPVRAFCLSFAMTLLLVGVAAPLAHAQDGASPTDATEDPGESRSMAFRAVEGAPGESVPGGALTVGAYAVTWLILMLFVFRLGRLHATAQHDLDRIGRLLEGKSGDNG